MKTARPSQRVEMVIAAGLLVTLLARPGYAQSPPAKYVATVWQAEQGLPSNSVADIAQDRDGYLWVASEGGLARFDGVHFRPFTKEDVPALRARRMSAVHADAGGEVWIGGWRTGLVRLHAGVSTAYTTRDGLPHDSIYSVLEDRAGDHWINTGVGPARLSHGSIEPYRTYRGKPVSDFLLQSGDGSMWFRSGQDVVRFGADGTFFSSKGGFMAREGRDGSVWIGFEDQYRAARYANGVFSDVELPRIRQPRWKGGHPRQGVLAMATDTDGELLLLTPAGLVRAVDGKLSLPEALPIPSNIGVVPEVHSMLVDREGNRWVGTASTGLFRFRPARLTAYARDEGLSNSLFHTPFQDREGRIWLATDDSLHWFDGRKFHLFPGLTGIGAIAQTPDDDLWFGGTGGLYRWRSGELTRYELQARDAYELLVDNHATVWIAAQIARLALGLFRFRNDVVQAVTDINEAAVTQDHEGGLWFYLGGAPKVVYMRDGKTIIYDQTRGLPAYLIVGISQDLSGTIWVTTGNGGLCRFRGGRFQVITTKQGLPDDLLWGGVDDGRGHLWVTSMRGIYRLSLRELNDVADGRISSISYVAFGIAEGMKTIDCPQGFPSAGIMARDGRIWFPTDRGVVAIDPSLPDPPPPPVILEEARAGQLAITHDGRASLPPGNNTFDFTFTGLNLAAAEQQRFKYRLDPYEQAWVDAGAQRTAHYTNMAPGKYTFRVIASNSYGVWNNEGASVGFMLNPHYYESRWFYAAMAACFFASLWALYQYRLRRLASEYSVRLQERVNERTRIARELHDTLLQNVQAALFQFRAAHNLLSRNADQAQATLNEAIVNTSKAVAEARESIQGLRGVAGELGALENLLTAAGHELSDADLTSADPPVFTVTVEGSTRALNPAVQDEVYRISREVLANAFQHAHGKRIEAEIRYDRRLFRLRIRDDGIGIDKTVLARGAREGHWGLPGIKERAKRIGAQVDIWSEPQAGTEFELRIPATVAYARSQNSARFRLLRKDREMSS